LVNDEEAMQFKGENKTHLDKYDGAYCW